MGFNIIFVDEFKVSNYTHLNYNWCKRGSYCGIPVPGFWKPYCAISAVSKDRLVKLTLPITNVKSSVFCVYMEELVAQLQREDPNDF